MIQLRPVFTALFFGLLFLLFSGNTSVTKEAIPENIDSFSLANGKIVYFEHCSGCHGSKGEGSYGPNLTDNYFLHGHHYHNVLHIIKHGKKTKGMTPFAHHLSHKQIRDVAHYVMTLKGTTPKSAKAPQGKLCK